MSQWHLPDRVLRLDGRALVMGIVNVTPDSFSDGGRFAAPEAAVAHALELVRQGADLLDVGGESSRPGAEPVPADEELRRVLPVVRELAGRTNVPISVDTTKAAVADACLAAGAHVVNDITALRGDPDLAGVAAARRAGVVLMHMRGTPPTMQDDPRYDDVTAEVCRFLEERLHAAAVAGIEANRVVLDPGIGFGKTTDHNLTLLARLGALRALGRPVLLGVSRKGFSGKVLGRGIDERLAGSLAAACRAITLGTAQVIRTHDVRETRDVVTLLAAIEQRAVQRREGGEGAPVRDRLAQIYESMGARDLVEIAILAAVIYVGLRFLRKSRGSGMVRGLGVVIIGLFLLAQAAIAVFDLTVLGKVLDYLHTTVLVGLLVIFQPELRRGLAVLGRYQVMRYLGRERHHPIADKLADASEAMSRDRIGALIAIQREVPLAPYVETGERLDGEISAGLLRTLFTPNSPLHDGAVILCNGRVAAAACQLPLGQPPDRGQVHVGMRHRAALGLSEETDAVLLVVSEETGRISLAVAGRLEAVPRENLSRRLVELLAHPSAARPTAKAA